MKRPLAAILLLFLSALAPAPAFPDYSHTPPDYSNFRAGLLSYESGRYSDAVKSFRASSESLPLIADYALLYMGQAYLKLHDPEAACEAAARMLNKHPGSPLEQAAMKVNVECTQGLGNKDLKWLLQAYVTKYPRDTEKSMLLAKLLIHPSSSPSDIKKGQELLLRIFIKAKRFSKEAYSLLDKASVRASDHVKRATNLIKAARYEEARACLKIALLLGQDVPEQEILEKLGLCFFRQKHYSKAAALFKKAGNTYMAALSMFRASDKAGFNKQLSRLVLEQDRKAGTLLLMSANAKRRAGKTRSALRVLQSVKSQYPSHAERALWHTGWTHYRARHYTKALDAFSTLYINKSTSRKYRYWMARALEKTGGKPNSTFRDLSAGGDYYAILSRNRLKGTGLKIKTAGLPVVPVSMDQKPPRPSLNGNTRTARLFGRVDLLLALKLKSEAKKELSHFIKQSLTDEEISLTAYRLSEMDEHKAAMRLIKRAREEFRPDEVLYPMAFRDTVRKVSKKYKVDPLLVLSVIREESRFDPYDVSRAGAMGLMQLMPSTARLLSRRLKLDLADMSRLYDVRTNINMGVYHLHKLLKKYRSIPKALAAYNAGEKKVNKWLKAGRYRSTDEFIEDIPYSETRAYVKRILKTYLKYSRAAEAAGPGKGWSTRQALASLGSLQ